MSKKKLDLDLFPNPPRVCRACGCTDAKGCEVGCAWAEDFYNICTRCASTAPFKVVRDIVSREWHVQGPGQTIVLFSHRDKVKVVRMAKAANEIWLHGRIVERSRVAVQAAFDLAAMYRCEHRRDGEAAALNAGITAKKKGKKSHA